ncbi:hypothetical protein [Pantoea sp. Lij88]|uniref:hypothetical protein n=1 Tax=Pantoea sp. Lij88 TaxID=3028622 RepID=UPI0024BB56B3|nr:hypothetical protein [Pantoea sp. Lij88]WHQ74634.1 hypothetical protein PU624_17760 [Pantoea sp. Lij88]
MSINSVSDITSPIANYGDYLERTAIEFHEKIERYWLSRDFLHKAFHVSIDESKSVIIAIPKMQFTCMSRNRLVFFEKSLLTEITFFVKNKKGDDEITLLKCYMGFEGGFNFHHPEDSEQLNYLNDDNVVTLLYQKLITSASDKKIISI